MDRVNKQSREVLSPCTGRGLVCMCVRVCVCLSSPAGSHLPRNESSPLRGLPHFEGLCVLCVYGVHMSACVCLYNNSFIRGLHGTFEHIKHPDMYLLHIYCVHALLCVQQTLVCKKRHAHTYRPTKISGFTSIHMDP